jgi:hypothetical protein
MYLLSAKQSKIINRQSNGHVFIVRLVVKKNTLSSYRYHPGLTSTQTCVLAAVACEGAVELFCLFQR